jgi:agmatine deiminase
VNPTTNRTIPSRVTTPADDGYRMPAEWEPHASTWVAWPSHEELWREHLAPVRAAFARFVGAIAQGEVAEVLVPDEAQEALAREALPEKNVRFHRVPFGDIWLRDTAPLFVVGDTAACASVRFGFNGWGRKYLLEHDDRVAERIAAVAGLPSFSMPFVFEGGAADVDGEGSVLTTRACVLNPNRNGPVGELDVEALLKAALGAEKVLWLGAGLLNDHTDGHVDTVARFVRPGVIVTMEPRGEDDPNREVLLELAREAATLRDARGRKLEVVRLPSPGRVLDGEGRILPASYVNFYIANASVCIPTYGTAWDDEAVDRIGAFFPERRAVGIDARALLTGGGALHCITQQQPRTSA